MARLAHPDRAPGVERSLRGIGRAVAIALAARGDRVAVLVNNAAVAPGAANRHPADSTSCADWQHACPR